MKSIETGRALYCYGFVDLNLLPRSSCQYVYKVLSKLLGFMETALLAVDCLLTLARDPAGRILVLLCGLRTTLHVPQVTQHSRPHNRRGTCWMVANR